MGLLQEVLNYKESKSYRFYNYPEPLKDAAAFAYMNSGLTFYNWFEHNLPLPSESTARKTIYQENTVIEGQLRIEELKKFLEEHKTTSRTSLSIDATRVVSRIQYHRKTNQIVGFVLPKNKLTRMPIPQSFPATSAKVIQNYFLKESCSKVISTMIEHLLLKKLLFLPTSLWLR